MDSINSQGTFNVTEIDDDENIKGKKTKALGEALYSIGNLRKRGHD